MPAGKDGQGVPRKMVAECLNCGQTYSGGTVTVWLKRGPEGYLTEPRDDVSFRCTKGCDEVQLMEVSIVARN